MADYIPASDSQFNTWQSNFLNYLLANFAKLDLAPEDFSDLVAAQTTWETFYTAHIAQRQAARGARQNKVNAKKSYVDAVRTFVRQLQTNPAVDDEHRSGLGVTVPDTERTPVATPTSNPIVLVDVANRLQHVLRFFDSESPTSRAKPFGVLGVEIWAKFGAAAPADPGELEFIEMATSAPVILDFPGEQGGQSVHYMCRWLSSRGDRGPWSETASATVAA